MTSPTAATYSVFIGAGFAFASWASRIPQVKGALDLSPGGLGLVLLSLAAGSVLALPLAGTVIHRLTTQRTVAVMSSVLALSLLGIGLGVRSGVGPVVVALFVFGLANGGWDVAMNVQAAEVERHLGRAIMPRFHAGYSLGTVLGALVGAAMVALHVSVTAHLCGAAVVIALTVPLLSRGFLPDVAQPAHRSQRTNRWRERRTLVIGVFVLAFAFAEGAANDWISVALIDGHHVAAAVGTLGSAVFLAAMTSARWVGPALLDRHGRVTVVRGLAVVAVVGLLLFVFGPSTPVAFVGAVLWGIGASLGFPVGMSAAADDPAAAAGRVSVVSSIGYCAFLGGPPLIGFLGSHGGVLHALSAVAALLALAALLAPALRPEEAA